MIYYVVSGGQPEKIFAIGGKFSSLEIDTEDTVCALMSFKQGSNNFPVTLFLSNAQTKEIRRFRIQFDDATVFCDFLEKLLTMYNKKGTIVTRKLYPKLRRNDLFLDEMKEFISAVREKHQPIVILYDGIESLKLALKIKEKINGQY